MKKLDGSHLSWTGSVVFVVLLGAAVTEATAQTSAAVIPDRMDRSREVTSRKLPAELRHLDDCDLLNDATLDVLRHGYVVVHREKIIAEARQGRETANFLLGALGGGDILDPWQANLIHGATSFQWASGELSEYVADREGQRKALQRDFRKAVRAGLRQRCTVFGSDRAWSYAPSYGSECAGLTNEPVDTLRHSGEFFGLGRELLPEVVDPSYRRRSVPYATPIDHERLEKALLRQKERYGHLSTRSRQVAMADCLVRIGAQAGKSERHSSSRQGNPDV